MVYARFSSMLPKSLLEGFRKQLMYNRIDIDEHRFVGFLFLYGFFLAIGISANALIFLDITPSIVFPLSFVAFIGIAYLLLKMSSEKKGKFVESILPDALRLIASNMKSGLTTERALFVAGRPEFGVLQLELRDASKKIASGEKVEDALKGIGEKINSKVLDETIWLISQGIKSGGQIADLLFQLSDDLKNQNQLQDEITSNISIYILLILFAAVFGAPLLFGISSFIVEVLTKQLAQASQIDTQGIQATGNLAALGGFTSGDKNVLSPDFILMFSVIMLIFTTTFSSLTIGVINTGKETGGIKYVLPLVLVGLFVFFAIREILKTFFGGLL